MGKGLLVSKVRDLDEPMKSKLIFMLLILLSWINRFNIFLQFYVGKINYNIFLWKKVIFMKLE